MKCVGILTSGGDAPGMNAAIRAVVRTAIYNDLKVMGIKRGYQGLIEGDIEEMNLSSVADIIHRGGTILRTSRSEEFETEKGLEKAMTMLEVFGIDVLVILGGDGTLLGARVLSRKGVPVIGIPCSIDNDCGWTDKTVGFMTAVETATEAISKIRDTSTSHGRANMIEVMGRHCGDIALYAGVAGGAESIIIPEIEANMDAVAKKVLQGKQRGKLHNIIIVAEGAGDVYEFCKEIHHKTDIEIRVTILGYIQRGGTPSIFDRIMASKMGHYAINLIKENKTGLVISYKNSEIVEQDIETALEIEKVLNREMYEMADILSI